MCASERGVRASKAMLRACLFSMRQLSGLRDFEWIRAMKKVQETNCPAVCTEVSQDCHYAPSGSRAFVGTLKRKTTVDSGVLSGKAGRLGTRMRGQRQ